MELDNANATIHSSIGDLSDDLDDYYTTLDSDLMEAMRLILASEANLTEDNAGLAEDIVTLSQLMQDLSADTLDDLSAKLRDIAGNLSAFDEETAASLTDMADDIDSFSQETKADTDEIDTTLNDLSKLDNIISDVQKVESDLDKAKTEIEADVATTHDEQMGRSTVNMALIAVVFVLLIIVLLLMFQNRKMAIEAPEPLREEDDMVILEDL
jgi:chromosome segregation ATPase